MRTPAQRLLNAVQRPAIYEEALIRSQGVPIALSIWHGGSDVPCVVFLPGTMTHPLFYEEFLDGLARAGFPVVGVHFQGHGKSPRVRRRLTFATLVQNARDAVRWARARFGRPVIVLGSSQGAVIALALAGNDDRFAAVVAHNVLDPRLPASLRITRLPAFLMPWHRLLTWAMRAGATVLPGLPVPFGWYLSMARVTGNRALQRQLTWDPLGLRAYPLAFLAGLFTADLSVLDSGRIRCPVLVIAATGDPLFPFDYVGEVYEELVAPTKELLVFDLPTHLLFNEALDTVLPPLCAALRRYGTAVGGPQVPAPTDCTPR
jgi:alpha-beta hydrolase superfamily lysophospholipase